MACTYNPCSKASHRAFYFALLKHAIKTMILVAASYYKEASFMLLKSPEDRNRAVTSIIIQPSTKDNKKCS